MDNQQENNNQIRKRKKQRRPLNINIGIVIFVVIGGYILYCLIAYMKSSPVAGYEVKVGSLTQPATFNGLCVRNEEVIYAEEAGYVNYYTREGERVSFGDLVYSVDSSGELAELLKSAGTDKNVMSDEDFTALSDSL